MEELAIFESTSISETGRIGVEQIDPTSTPDEASLNTKNGDTVSAFPTTSGNAVVIQPEEDGPHPGVLLNEDVLESVFKHVINPSSSLFTCKRMNNIYIRNNVRNIRLVCKTWRNVITPLYRRAQAPTVFDQEQFRWKWEPRYPGLKTFLAVMKNSDLIPVQYYTFNDHYFRNDNENELFSDFLLTFGSDIVSLYLSFDPVKGFDVTGLGDLKLEKLKKLEIHALDCTGSRTHTFGPFLKILMNSAVAIEEFKFNFGNYSFAFLTEAFERIIFQGLPTTVKILHLSNIRLEEESFAALAATGLKLEEFQLDGSCFPGKNQLVIRKFMESQTNTLKTLLIKGKYISESTEFEFPKLNELLCLEMNGIHVKPFSFTKTFPKLQKLDVGDWYEKHASTLVELLSYERIIPSVKEVIMPVSWTSNAHAQVAKTVLEHFPNITTLHVCPRSNRGDVTKTLQEIFTHFRNIEQLNISMCLSKQDAFNMDSLFSGVSEAGCKRIWNWRESNFAGIYPREEQSMPSILNLTKLKKLVVTVTQIYGLCPYILTDITAHFVFLQMANLRELSLGYATISPTYVDLLKEKLDLEIELDDFKYSDEYSNEED